MDSIEALTTFIGWCTILNLVIILLIVAFSFFFHEGQGRYYERLWGISQENAKMTWSLAFQIYRVLFVFFNLVPYVVLKIMA